VYGEVSEAHVCLQRVVPAWLAHHRDLDTHPLSYAGRVARAPPQAVAPLGHATNVSWLQTLNGQLDNHPTLEDLVGVHRRTGQAIPECAETWTIAPASAVEMVARACLSREMGDHKAKAFAEMPLCWLDAEAAWTLSTLRSIHFL